MILSFWIKRAQLSNKTTTHTVGVRACESVSVPRPVRAYSFCDAKSNAMWDPNTMLWFCVLFHVVSNNFIKELLDVTELLVLRAFVAGKALYSSVTWMQRLSVDT